MGYLGEEIRKLGFGFMRLPMLGEEVDIKQLQEMVDLFLEKGFTYFDTAYGYINGKSEEAIKTTLVDRYPREKYQLATKLPSWFAATADEAKGMFWTSLKRTGVDYFDFYLLHNLGVGRTESFDKFGIWEFLDEQKKQGRIKHLGFSLHGTADCLDKILTQHPEMEFVQLQINYADWNDGIVQSGKCYEVAKKHGKPIIIMEPVKGGTLSNLPKQAADILTGANQNVSTSSWGIRFAASLEGIITVLSGMSTIEQMEDNLSYMGEFEPLNEEEKIAIEKAQESLAKIPRIPCTDCKYCVEGCPQNIAIPGTFKAFNHYLIYDNLKGAKNSYAWETSRMAKASECVACGACEVVCPQSISIIEELGRAAVVLED